MSTRPSKSRVEAARTGPRIPLFAVAVIGLVVVLVAAGIAIALTGGDDDTTTTGGGGGAASTSPAAGTQPFGPVTVEGEALAPFPDGGDDPAVGTPAPTLVGETPGGAPLTIDPGDGPMVVAFVAHWCPHCQAEVPRIVELAGGKAEIDGVRLVAVATGTDPQAPNFPPGEWLAGEDWPGPALLDSDQAAAAAAYGVAGYPFLVAVDGDGNVVARSSGEQGDEGLRAFFARAAAA